MSDGLPRGYDKWRTACEPDYPKMRYTYHCEDCDRPICDGTGFYELDGFVYCPQCLDRNYRQTTEKDELCEVCEEVIPYDEFAYKIHDEWICEKCIRDFEERG